MEMNTIKTDFLNYIKYEKKQSDRTYSTYQAWLNRYERWLPENGFPNPSVEDAMSRTNLRTYYYSLAESRGRGGEALRPRTLRAAFHPLRALGEFLVEHKLLVENTAKTAVKMPKKDAARRLLVTDAEVFGLLDAAERQADSRNIALSTALLATLLYTGVRAEELVSLRLEDVSIENGTLLVANGKGGKSHLLHPAPEFFTVVRTWLRERDRIRCEHSWLWAQGPRRGVSYEWLLRHLEELKAVAGYKGAPNIKPHSLRHWFATNLYRQVKNIKVVQQALGHSDTHTTYMYLHLDEEDSYAMSAMTLGRPRDAGDDAPTPRAERPAPKPAGRAVLAAPAEPASTRASLNRMRRQPTRAGR